MVVVVGLFEDIFVDQVVQFGVNFTFFVADDDCLSIYNCFSNNIQVFLATRLIEYLLRLDLEVRNQPVVSLLLRIEQVVGPVLPDCDDGTLRVEYVVRQQTVPPLRNRLLGAVELGELLVGIDFDVVDH